jgi:hypothetical protein
LSGPGVSLAIRGDDTTSLNGSGAEQFSATEGKISISGTFDWKEYQVKMVNVKADIKSLTVFLIYMPGTQGEVYFDDVSLTY